MLQRLDPIDSAPLLARYDMDRAARTLTTRSLAERHGPGMWRWEELLPVREVRHRIHLGEGSTPLLPAARLGPALGLDRLLVKAEGVNPTGSFKARGMAAAVSRARELGARELIVPSAGNAGGALAAYGAAAGLPVTVVLPADTPRANVEEALMCGARVIGVEGFISDCGRVAAAIADHTEAFDVSTLKEPYRVEGKKTMGLELVEQLSWTTPDVIVYPTGGGTGLVGMWKAFDELEALGLLGTGRPRMVSVQAQGCAPIVRAFAEGAEAASPWQDPSTRASGLRVPSAVGDRLILQALRESSGTAVAVPEAEIDALQRLAGRRGLGYVAPETAAALAAVASLADDGWLSANERVVVFDTGVGHKYPAPSLPEMPVVSPTVAEDPEAIAQLLGERVRRRSPETVTSQPAAPAGPPANPSARAEPETAQPETADSEVAGPAPMPRRPRSQPSTTTPGSRRLRGLMSRRVAERDQAVGDPMRITSVGGPRVPGESPEAAAPTPEPPAPTPEPPAPTHEPPAPTPEPPPPPPGPSSTTAAREDAVAPLPPPPFREIVVGPLPRPPRSA